MVWHPRLPASSLINVNLGNWEDLAPVPGITLESLATKIEGEDREGFLRWLRLALQWDPTNRPSALGLLYDEWLMTGLKLKGKAERSR